MKSPGFGLQLGAKNLCDCESLQSQLQISVSHPQNDGIELWLLFSFPPLRHYDFIVSFKKYRRLDYIYNKFNSYPLYINFLYELVFACGYAVSFLFLRRYHP